MISTLRLLFGVYIRLLHQSYHGCSLFTAKSKCQILVLVSQCEDLNPAIWWDTMPFIETIRDTSFQSAKAPSYTVFGVCQLLSPIFLLVHVFYLMPAHANNRPKSFCRRHLDSCLNRSANHFNIWSHAQFLPCKSLHVINRVSFSCYSYIVRVVHQIRR